MSPSADPPLVRLSHLDDLWFQVAGTLCNLTCVHCFISCSPKNHAFEFLTLDEVRRRLDESVPLGVKEYYFTGGEPFLNPEMTAILELALGYGPATVLTNATAFTAKNLDRLAAAEAASPFSLEFRVSIDGFTAEANDPIRGEGSFARALRGVAMLVERGFLPIITAARVWPEEQDREVVEGFLRVLKSHGCTRPRLKLLPRLRIGAEARRTCGYDSTERVTAEMLEGFDASQLICEHSRIVTDRGVAVCPILIESPDAILGKTLGESSRPYALRHGACLTCYQYGAICSNPSRGLESTASS